MRTRLRETLLHSVLSLVRRFDRRVPDPSMLGTGRVRRILAISCTAIGDTLLSTPGIRSLRLAHPDARISLLLNAAQVELFAGNPDVDEIIPYFGGYRRFLRLAYALWSRHFDVAVIFHGNEPQATPLAYLSGAAFRFKLPNDNRFRFLLTNREPVSRWEDFGHGIDQRLAVAALAGGAPTDRRMTLPVRQDSCQAVQAFLAETGVDVDTTCIGFQVGASTVSRRWSPENYGALGRQLLAAYPGACIVITGSPAERALAEQVKSLIGSDRVVVAAGGLPLHFMPALLSRLAVLVTGDTGPMHMAVALGTPVVALFAVSDWRRSGPGYDLNRHIIIQKWRTCDPCLSKNCPYDRPLCMANISVDEVAVAVHSSLPAAQAG